MSELPLDTVPAVRVVGANRVRVWGLEPAERVRRIAGKAGLAMAAPDQAGPMLIVSSDFAFDPHWLAFMRQRPGAVLMLGGMPAIAHAAGGQAIDDPALTPIAAENNGETYNLALRKREWPFLLPLTRANVPEIERASYYGAYKGVTDLLTKYLWPELALVLTRAAARARITPNMVTIAGIVLCVAATFAFWRGHYWLGMAEGLVFMMLDTVDGKLARCTITSSRIGDVLDHGVDLVHPPFWWWAWAHGLGAWGLAYSTIASWWVFGTILAGYIVQRAIEGAFIARFGMHIHVWERFDSRFRLITARRNPNMVILFVATLLRRPDIGLEAVAWWTAISCLTHLIRLGQAEIEARRGHKPRSWLEA